MKTPFALAMPHGNSDHIYCLNPAAELSGLSIGMAVSQARALCRNLTLHPADPTGDARFLSRLRRWSQRYTPFATVDGTDCVLLDITGADHLFGGEGPMVQDMRRRLGHMGLSCRIGLADTRSAAWALAHYQPGAAVAGETAEAVTGLPVAALRLSEDKIVALQRLGLRTIGDLQATARAPLSRRFGPDLLMKLDQINAMRAEPLSPQQDPPVFAVSMTLPEPIGLLQDLSAGLEVLLGRLCAKLLEHLSGTRSMEFNLRRVDKASITLPIRLAAPMRDASRLLPLFTRQLESVNSGFGIDQLRLLATQVEPLPYEQSGTKQAPDLADLITRIGTRIGLDNIHRFTPRDSHWPEHSYSLSPAANVGSVLSGPASSTDILNKWPDTSSDTWPTKRLRPTHIFRPEPIYAQAIRSSTPPAEFQWRRWLFTTADAIGPERIAAEWWNNDEPLRDYWRIQTKEGRRLWLFFTPQSPSWYVQGEFA